MRSVAVLTILALLAGCADIKLISSGKRSIIVGGPIDKMDEMLNVAEAECQKQGLHAELAGRISSHQYSYSCVR
jgi:hypothetical protein